MKHVTIEMIMFFDENDNDEWIVSNNWFSQIWLRLYVMHQKTFVSQRHTHVHMGKETLFAIERVLFMLMLKSNCLDNLS